MAMGYGERHTGECDTVLPKISVLPLARNSILVKFQFPLFFCKPLPHFDTDITGKSSHRHIDPIVDPDCTIPIATVPDMDNALSADQPALLAASSAPANGQPLNNPVSASA